MHLLAPAIAAASSRRSAGVLADTINDATSTRNVYLLAAALAFLGIALIVITIWFWRTTRHDPEVLGPLEALGTRRFRSVDDGGKQELLDAARPADAKPMKWGVVRGAATEQSGVDLDDIEKDGRTDFDDLREPAAGESVDIEQLDPPPDLMPTDAEAIRTAMDTSESSDDAPDVAADLADHLVANGEIEASEAAIEAEDKSQPPLVIAPLDMGLRGVETAALSQRPITQSIQVESAATAAMAELDSQGGDEAGSHEDAVSGSDADLDPDRTDLQSRNVIDPLLRRLERHD